jgi:hypothetical protein
LTGCERVKNGTLDDNDWGDLQDAIDKRLSEIAGEGVDDGK